MEGIGRTFLCVILLLSAVSLCKSSQYIVVPEDGRMTIDDCPEGYTECNDLSYYARQSDTYFTSDTIVTFLPGTHILDYSGPIVISDVSNLTLQGNGTIADGFHWTLKQSDVVITCNGHKSGFLVKNFDGVTFSGLTITDCGFNLTNGPLQYVLDHFDLGIYGWNYSISLTAFFSLLTLNGTDLSMEETVVKNGLGFGLCTVNVYNMDIYASEFFDNNVVCDDHTFGMSAGGNIRITYIRSTGCPAGITGDINSVLIRDVSIINGRSGGGDLLNTDGSIFDDVSQSAGGGLAFMTFSETCGLLEYIIDNVNTINNQGDVGSNVLLLGIPVSASFNNLNCSFGMESSFGSGMTLAVTHSFPSGYSGNVSITNSVFIGNSRTEDNAGSGTAFLMLNFAFKGYDHITFESCYFHDNKGVSTVRIEENNDVFSREPLNVHFANVTFYRNGEHTLQGTYDFSAALLLINCVADASNLSVIDTQCSGIQLVNTKLTVTGNVLLQNNTHKNGGGMTLRGHSFIVFKPPLAVSFINNHANEFGGAIYVASNDDDILISPCFYQVDTTSPKPDVVIYAENNTAKRSGSFLSGGDLGLCYGVVNSPHPIPLRHPNTYEDFLSFFSPGSLNIMDKQFIVSTPVAVAYCHKGGDYYPSDRYIEPPIEFYQGKLFNISFATINPIGGIFPGLMQIKIYNCSSKACFNDVEMLSFEIYSDSKCTTIDFVITANSYTNELVLKLTTLVRISFDLLSPLRITLKSMECPPGFVKKEICECNEFVKLIGATCNINTTSISTNGGVWIGYDSTSNTTLYSYDCPIGYCVNEPVTFNILEPDAQCAYNRSGILCGGCAEGYSLLLGTNECGECPNDNYLSLLLVFGVAGILLVVLLILLNLTVSVGTINGLVFFANIVKINENVFFPPHLSTSIGTVLFKPFISFLNLDFGIKSCFYNGMTPYEKAWLQFAFPVYIWVIIFVIMFLSQRSMRMAKLMGNDSVKVLATLFLLSYMKIIFALGRVLGAEKVYYNTASSFVWRFDGNIEFCGGLEHSILVGFAILFFFIIVVPYSLMLILLPFIDRLSAPSNTCIRQFLLRLKLLTDAYAGPFKDSHRFWLGLLLVSRVILTVAYFIDQHGVSLYLAVTCIIFLLTLGYNLQGPYKSNYLNVLESWFLANLLVLLMVGMSNEESYMLKIGRMVCLTLAFITFLCILVYHVLLQMKRHGLLMKCRPICKTRRAKTPDLSLSLSTTINDTIEKYDLAADLSMEEEDDVVSKIGALKCDYSKQEFSKYRESILSDT